MYEKNRNAIINNSSFPSDIIEIILSFCEDKMKKWSINHKQESVMMIRHICTKSIEFGNIKGFFIRGSVIDSDTYIGMLDTLKQYNYVDRYTYGRLKIDDTLWKKIISPGKQPAYRAYYPLLYETNMQYYTFNFYW
jgi:hypothetical protein